jgi:LPS-assembly protein
MGRCPGSVRWLPLVTIYCFTLLSFCSLITSLAFGANEPAAPVTPASPSSTTVTKVPASPEPIEITAERTEYLQGNDVYEADGSVVVVQGRRRLTADHMTLFMLSGTMVATGHVHLSDPLTETFADRLELNVNTEMGVIVNGRLFVRESNTLVTGRLLQRFSETHYRAKEGSFTNCDANEGQVPAWRFTFKDLDLSMGERLFLNDTWFCINDHPILKLPTFAYPIQTSRKSGLLIPTIAYDNRFGWHYRQGIYWAISPSQDMMFSPELYTNRGYGGDIEYRYILNRKSKGYWLTSILQDTEVNRLRGLVSGTHTQQINPDLKVNTQAFLVSDPNYLSQLSNSGVQRALPSGESDLNINRRFSHGTLYLLGQYLQPLSSGGEDTFQRLPEIGHRLINVAPWGGPVQVGSEETFVNFYRDEGFTFNRVDLVPAISTDVVNIGRLVGFTPQAKFREVYYTRGATSSGEVHRETFWAAMEASSRLSRRYPLGEGRSLLHTLEPNVIYEYVPRSDQSNIIQVDDVDNLPQKNLITYSLRSRLFERQGSNMNHWMDLMVAQSYHPGSTPNQAREFILPGDPLFGVAPPFIGSPTQPIQPTLVPVHTNKFSDIWTRATFGNPYAVAMIGQPVTPSLTVDAFFDPYRGNVSQFNTDLRVNQGKLWYVEVGQRYTQAGNRPRRGDIWNPISFNEVFAPTSEINFVTAGGAFRAPLGWIIGARTYYDMDSGIRPETDIVALYRNRCQCWSFGFYYIEFPDRVQYNFMITLTGIGATENFGTQVLRALIGPLVYGERALPWPSPMGKIPRETMATPPTPRP